VIKLPKKSGGTGLQPVQMLAKAEESMKPGNFARNFKSYPLFPSAALEPVIHVLQEHPKP